MIDPEPPSPPKPPRTVNTPTVRTRTALLKPITWRPEPLDVVLVLGFLLLVGGIAWKLSIADGLIVAGVLLLVAWVRIAIAVQGAKNDGAAVGDGQRSV